MLHAGGNTVCAPDHIGAPETELDRTHLSKQ